MIRLITLAVVLGLLGAGLSMGDVATAEEVKKGKPEIASDEEVAEALAQFKIDFKARGVPKEDVISQRNYAMKKIAPLQHRDVIAVLAKLTKNSNEDLRRLALIYLGDQTLNPYLAAQPILAAMKRYKRDKGILMTGLTSLCTLKYLGARKELSALLAHKEFAVKKFTIATIGEIKDLRMLKEVLRLLGVDVDATSEQANAAKTDNGPGSGPSGDGGSSPSAPGGGGDSESGGGGETSEPGYSWGGVDVFVPEGEDPEKAVRDAQERNRSAAEAAARGRGGASGGGGASAPSGGSSSSPTPGASAPAPASAPGSGTSQRGSASSNRGAEELIPTILVTLRKLTGKRFKDPDHVKEWLAENSRAVRERQRLLDEEEKAQKAMGKKTRK